MTSPAPSRRAFLKTAAFGGAALATGAARASRYNVLFFMADDMRPELDCYGNPLVATPHLTALARSGVRFDRAYCPYPLCCPSRSATLTGRHTNQVQVFGNRTWFGDVHPELVSLPKYFKRQGYTTCRTGKIFHGGIDDTEAWTEGGERRVLAGADDSDAAAALPRPGRERRAPTGIEAANRRLSRSAGLSHGRYSDRAIMLEGDGEGHGDYATADAAIDYLRRHKDDTFFIGCGFVKPHSPPTAPKKYFDRIAVGDVKLPVDFAAHRALPPGFPEGCLRPHNADLFINRDATPQAAREMIRAYYASIAWTDWNIGRVIGELDRLGLRDKTIICFSADHGYQLGEKGKWSKAGSLWEEGARVPLILAVPGARGNGRPCYRLVETLNLYPTLVDLCRLPMPAGQAGVSMAALLDRPEADWDRPAHTVWSEDGKSLTGLGVRRGRWRYAEYDLGGPMLLDMENDPHQLVNLAHDPRHADVTAEMSRLVREYRSFAHA